MRTGLGPHPAGPAQQLTDEDQTGMSGGLESSDTLPPWATAGDRGGPESSVSRRDVRQLRSNLMMRRRMAALSEERLANWNQLPAAEKLELHIDKLEIEADTQRRIAARSAENTSAMPRSQVASPVAAWNSSAAAPPITLCRANHALSDQAIATIAILAYSRAWRRCLHMSSRSMSIVSEATSRRSISPIRSRRKCQLDHAARPDLARLDCRDPPMSEFWRPCSILDEFRTCF